MRRKIGLGVLSLLAVGMVGHVAHGVGQPRGGQVQRDHPSPKSVSVRERVEQVQAESRASLSVDVADSTFLGLTVMDRAGDALVLDFEPDATDDTWAPVLPEGTEAGVFGTDLKLWFFSGLVAGDEATAPKVELEPLGSGIAEVPHDDVTVIVVDETLVLVALWKDGQVIGVYFAIDTATEGTVAGEGEVAAEADQSPRQRVCGKLFNTCVGEKNTYWVFACAGWLYFCGVQ